MTKKKVNKVELKGRVTRNRLQLIKNQIHSLSKQIEKNTKNGKKDVMLTFRLKQAHEKLKCFENKSSNALEDEVNIKKLAAKNAIKDYMIKVEKEYRKEHNIAGYSGARLYPNDSQNRKTNRHKLDEWKRLRGMKKRNAIEAGVEIEKRRIDIDNCDDCGTILIVDHESSRFICPTCGKTKILYSYVFDMKELCPSQWNTYNNHQSLTHMTKYMTQWERGFPEATPKVLETLITKGYSKYQLHDPQKATPHQTGKFIKKLPIPKLYQRADARLTKELCREPIPEFSSEEMNLLINQRNRLTSQTDGEKKRKTFNNSNFIRNLGRSAKMEQARLFRNYKTDLHIERSNDLEREIERQIQESKYMKKTVTFYPMYPAS